MTGLAATLAEILDQEVVRVAPLAGGCVADVRRADLADGSRVVVKHDPDGGLEIEGWMLRELARHGLPVPEVRHVDDHLLVMAFLETGGALDDRAQTHAADLLAALHGVGAEAYGLDRATVIGGLPQPNPREADWRVFFRDHRLIQMADQALAAGRLPTGLRHRIERLGDRLDALIPEPQAPGLIHGDMWGGNILTRPGGVAGFIDPAIYFADPEIELAFSTLFATFGDAFFRRYQEHRPLAPGFFEERRDLYNLYPLLVHVRLFGGGYVGSVDRTLRRFGV